MRFSERIGKRKVSEVIQLDSMTDELRNRLWNVVAIIIFQNAFSRRQFDASRPNDEFMTFLRRLWHSYYKMTIEGIPQTEQDVRHFLKTYFFQCEWYEVFDFIEFTFNDFNSEDYVGSLNHVLEAELSGYRIVKDRFIRATDDREISSIEEALSSASPYRNVEEHLNTAFSHLSSRDNPDFRNSIKESISAVEAICRNILGDENGTLGKLLNQLEQERKLHGALKSSYSSLYGYASDSGGIRHSLMDEKRLTFDDAYFFFIQCSSFVHYLIKITE